MVDISSAGNGRGAHLPIVESDDGKFGADRPSQSALLVMFGAHADEAAARNIEDEVGLLRELEFRPVEVYPRRDRLATSVKKFRELFSCQRREGDRTNV